MPAAGREQTRLAHRTRHSCGASPDLRFSAPVVRPGSAVQGAIGRGWVDPHGDVAALWESGSGRHRLLPSAERDYAVRFGSGRSDSEYPWFSTEKGLFRLRSRPFRRFQVRT